MIVPKRRLSPLHKAPQAELPLGGGSFPVAGTWGCMPVALLRVEKQTYAQAQMLKINRNTECRSHESKPAHLQPQS